VRKMTQQDGAAERHVGEPGLRPFA
jgi:hypothetical protein